MAKEIFTVEMADWLEAKLSSKPIIGLVVTRSTAKAVFAYSIDADFHESEVGQWLPRSQVKLTVADTAFRKILKAARLSVELAVMKDAMAKALTTPFALMVYFPASADGSMYTHFTSYPSEELRQAAALKIEQGFRLYGLTGRKVLPFMMSAKTFIAMYTTGTAVADAEDANHTHPADEISGEVFQKLYEVLAS
jgi:hypothetical protein